MLWPTDWTSKCSFLLLMANQHALIHRKLVKGIRQSGTASAKHTLRFSTPSRSA